MLHNRFGISGTIETTSSPLLFTLHCSAHVSVNEKPRTVNRCILAFLLSKTDHPAACCMTQLTLTPPATQFAHGHKTSRLQRASNFCPPSFRHSVTFRSTNQRNREVSDTPCGLRAAEDPHASLGRAALWSGRRCEAAVLRAVWSRIPVGPPVDLLLLVGGPVHT